MRKATLMISLWMKYLNNKIDPLLFQISVLSGSAWHYNYLFTSQDPWQRKILDNYKFKDTVTKSSKLINGEQR